MLSYVPPWISSALTRAVPAPLPAPTADSKRPITLAPLAVPYAGVQRLSAISSTALLTAKLTAVPAAAGGTASPRDGADPMRPSLSQHTAVAAATATPWGAEAPPTRASVAVDSAGGRIVLGGTKKHKHHLSRISIADFYRKRGSAANLHARSAVPVLELLAECVPLSTALLRLCFEYANGTGRVVLLAGHTYSPETDLRLNVDFCDRLEVLDVATQQWLGLHACPVRWPEPSHDAHGDDAALTVYRDAIYFVGGSGFTASSAVTALDLPPAASATSATLVPSPKSGASDTGAGGGGVRALRPMKVSRDRCAAVGARGRLYVFGGESEGHPLDTVEVYNPQTDAWSFAAKMPAAASRLVAFASHDERFIILCGSTQPSNSPTARSARANSAANRYAVPAAAEDGDGASGPRDQAWRYDVIHNSYALLAPISVEDCASGCWWKGAAVVASIRAGTLRPVNQTLPSVDLLAGVGLSAGSGVPTDGGTALALRRLTWTALSGALPTCDVRKRLCLYAPSDRRLYLFSEAREERDTLLQVYDEQARVWTKVLIADHAPIQSYAAVFVP